MGWFATCLSNGSPRSFSDLLYGTIFTNHFTERKKSLASQCEDVLDILFYGLLINGKREAHG